MKEHPKLLFVIKGSALNRRMNTGIENLAWGLAERGFTVDILSCGTHPEEHGYSLPENVTYHFCGGDGGIGQHVDGYRKLRAKHGYDAVIGWIRLIAPLAEIERSDYPASRTKFIANEGQGTKKYGVLSRIRRIVAALLKGVRLPTKYELLRSQPTQGAQIDHVVAVTEDVKRNLEDVYSVDAAKVTVINRGIDSKIFNSMRGNDYELSNPVRLVYAGNICKEKGLADVATALALVKYPVDWIICGKDLGILNTLKLKIEKSASHHRIHYRGMIKPRDLAEEFSYADIFVLCSWSEGAAKSLLEAMGCALPVVVSDLETFRGLIKHRHNALVAEPREPSSIANAINQFIASKDMREHCGQNAAQTIDGGYTAEHEVSAWERLLLLQLT